MLKNRFGMIPGRNIKGMICRRWKVTAPFESRLSITDSTRTSRVKPRLVRFGGRERMWNVCLHGIDYHLCYAFGTKRRISVTEAIIIPREISKVPPQVLPPSRGKMPIASPLWWVLGGHRSDRTKNRN